MKYCYFDTPIGSILLAGGQSGLKLISFSSGSTQKRPQENWKEDPGLFHDAMEEIERYFSGDLKQFSTRILPEGTPFQIKVWKALRKIPYGKTISYGELAKRVDNPKAARAVGMANHRNPIPIIIPCHRVIGKDGKLTGFGGGLDVKQRLLDLEKQYF